jgi:hypothetical protein
MNADTGAPGAVRGAHLLPDPTRPTAIMPRTELDRVVAPAYSRHTAPSLGFHGNGNDQFVRISFDGPGGSVDVPCRVTPRRLYGHHLNSLHSMGKPHML